MAYSTGELTMNAPIWLIPTALGAACVGGLLRSQYERDHFVTEETVISSKKIKKPKTLIFLSDMHDKEFGEKNERLLAAIGKSHPDLILIGGDTMVAKEGRGNLEATENLIRGLVKIAPVYYGNGNHEQRLHTDRECYGDCYQRFCKLLKQHGVIYLSDASADVGEDMTISGLNIGKAYYKDFVPEKMKPGYIASHLGPADPERFQILLAHSPMFLDAYSVWGADLTLSGHFHGGTVRLPFLGGLMTPQLQFFLPWCAGTFEEDGHHMIVSRGLGTHSVNIRFNNKPQVVAVKLQPALQG